MEVKGTLAGLFFKICLKREDLASRPGRLWVECEVQADDTRQMSTGDLFPFLLKALEFFKASSYWISCGQEN